MIKNIITKKDFKRMFNCLDDLFPKLFFDKLKYSNIRYKFPNQKEYDDYIIDVLKKINSIQISRTKNENKIIFEKGWSENLINIKRTGVTQEALKPKYFHKNKYLRYNKKLIVSKNINLEYDLFTLTRYIIFNKYLAPFDNIYEIGCGSCQNLFMLSEMYPDKMLFGFDFVNSAIKIADYIAKTLKRNIKGQLFDMFDPSCDVRIQQGSAIITIHSLEQIGRNHKKLLAYILKSNPGIVVHYEPVIELYDENNLLDYLAIMYSKKRNYLIGYYDALKALENKNKIEIIEIKRPHLGGIIHESSLLVWRPKHGIKNDYR